MTPGYMTPVRCVSTPASPGPVAPPPYSPPSLIYCPDPTPSLASRNIVNSPAHCSGGSVIIIPECPRPETPVFNRQSVLTLPKGPMSVKMIEINKSCGRKYKMNFPKNFSSFVRKSLRILAPTVN